MKKSFSIAILSLAALGITSLNPHAQAAAFQNGGFELGTTGWSSTGHVQLALSGQGSTEGTHDTVFNAGDLTPNGVIWQTFDTIALQVYTVTFDWGAFAAQGPQDQRIQVEVRDGSSQTAGAEDIVSGSGTLNTINGTTIFSNTTLFTLDNASPTAENGPSEGVAAPNASFSAAGFTFTAQSTSSTIVFSDKATSSGRSSDAALDNVQVVPEPSAWLSMVGGLGMLAGLLRFGRKRAA